MPKQVCFIDSDKELLKEIETFQKVQELPSFIEAIRRLCKNGLLMSDVVKNLI